MFEDKTYENILDDMLTRVTSDVDKREGSIIYDALAPCAYQLAQNYFNMNNFIDLVFGDTSVGEYLDRVVAAYGISRNPATYAVRKIETTGEIDIGTRWGIFDTTYAITEVIATNIYKAQCEQIGELGNQYSGVLENIDNVDGVTANLTEILIVGEDEETDDALRTRYYNKVQNNVQDGNIKQYIEWADEFAGIGRSKVIPLWNGDNTVKVSILDATNDIATSELIALFQIYLDPNSEGLGEGKAPIGSIVTVDTATGLNINISATITLNAGYTMEDAQTQAEEAIEQYFRDLSYAKTSVSLIALGSEILAKAAIASISDVLLNSVASDMSLGNEEIPQMGTVTLS
ncbi:MAG: baseplate J/gp47 family protein [Clostridia bacterium]|nr:baseplate J/gp47 family protein [Clostridia bacterium]MDD4027311.1 baseplate J/gp47 family protein [Candidatus Shapirobacteria bacterium]